MNGSQGMRYRVALLVGVVGFSCLAHVVHLGKTDANGYPVIVPTVKRLTPSQGVFSIPAKLSVAPLEGVDLQAFKRVYATEVSGGHVVEDTDGTGLIRFVISEGDVPEDRQGYRLEIRPDGIVIRARTKVGLFYGLQTVGWLVRNRTGESIRCCSIDDWPDMKGRGVMLKKKGGFDSSEMPRLCEVLEELASIKCNFALCDLSGNLPLSIADEFSFDSHVTKADVAMFVETARRNHITLMPGIQFASHTSWLSYHRDWQSMKEGQPWLNDWCCSYCPRNKNVQRIAETFLREACDLFNPKVFCLYLDELSLCPYGVCPVCKGKDPAEGVLEHVRPLQAILRERDIRSVVAHDEFVTGDMLRKDSAFVSCLNGLDSKTILMPWLYKHTPQELVFRQVKDMGHDLMFMSFMRVLPNVTSYPRLAAANGVSCGILSYWGMISDTFDNFDTECGRSWCTPDAMMATLLHASCCWNVRSPEIFDVPYDGSEQFKHVFAPSRLVRFSSPPVELPIDGACTALVGGAGDRRFPEFDRQTITEIAAVAAKDDERYRLPTTEAGDRIKAIVLAGATDDTSLPGEVRIPLKGRAEGFSFLCAAASFDDYVKVPAKPIAAITIVYEDGSRETQELICRRDLAYWNDFNGSALGRIVLRATDAKDAVVNLSSYPMQNPKPSAAISELILSSRCLGGISPMFLAVSGHGLSSTPPPLAAKGVLRDLVNGKMKLEVVHDYAVNGLNDVDVIFTTPPGEEEGETSKEIIDVPGYGQVLKVVVPPPRKSVNRRICVDVTIPSGIRAGAGTYFADFQIDRPGTVMRADTYLIGKPGLRRIFEFDRGLSFGSGWTRVQLPVRAYRETEKGGCEDAAIRQLRLGFFLSNATPVTFYFGRVEHTDAVLPARFDIKMK